MPEPKALLNARVAAQSPVKGPADTVAADGVGYTMCDNCNHVPMCGIRFHTRQGVIHRMESFGPSGPLCVKAYGLMQQLYHPDRLLYPLHRTTPKGQAPHFERISWNEAYGIIAEKMLALRASHGADSVFFYTGAPKELRPPLERLATLFGSINYGTESSTACMRSAFFANHLCFGFNGIQKYPKPETPVAVLWGVNPAVSHSQAMPGLLAARDAGCRFIHIDPRESPTVRLLGGLHLRPRLGSTAALAHGLAHCLLHQEPGTQAYGIDRAWCAEHIHGFDAYCDLVDAFPPARAAALCGVPEADIRAAAILLGQAWASGKQPGSLPTFMASSQSTTHDRNGVQNHRAICLLAALCGAVPPPSAPSGLRDFDIWANGGPHDFSLREQRMAWNRECWEAPATARHYRIDSPHVPAWARWAWEVNTSFLPEAIAEGRIQALLSFGLNTMIWPSSRTYSQAFSQLALGVAVDYFYRPASHDALDIILPAAMNFERSAPFAVWGNQIMGRTPLPPLGEAREDWRILLELGCALGYAEQCFHGSPKAACNAVLSRWNLNMDILQSHAAQGKTIDLPPEAFPPAPTSAGVCASLSTEYPTPTGKIEAWSTLLDECGLPPLPEFQPPLALSSDFPLQLLSGTRRHHLTHSRTRTDCPWLNELDPVPQVELNPADAAARNIAQGDQVLLCSAWGEIELYAELDSALPPGMVGLMHGWAKANANDLAPRLFDPVSGYPALKEVPVQVRPKHSAPRPAYGFLLDLGRCIGCRACTVACQMENFTPPGITWCRMHEIKAPQHSLVRHSCLHCAPVLSPASEFVQEASGQKASWQKASWQEASWQEALLQEASWKEAPCIQACRAQALTRENHGVALNGALCVGCGACVRACPWQAVALTPTPSGALLAYEQPAQRMPHQVHSPGKASKCTLCAHRQPQPVPGQPLPDYCPACVQACPVTALEFGPVNGHTPFAQAWRKALALPGQENGCIRYRA